LAGDQAGFGPAGLV